MEEFLQTLHATSESTEELLYNAERFKALLNEKNENEKKSLIELKEENEKLKTELQKEEEWAKCVAHDVISDEESFKIGMLKAIWELSRFDTNIKDMIEEDVPNLLIEYLSSESNHEILASCLGILGNIAAIEEFRKILVDEYTTCIGQAIKIAKNILDASEYCLIDARESISYLSNISMEKFMANMIVQCGTLETVAYSINKFEENDTFVDLLVQLATNLLNNTDKHPKEECDMLKQSLMSLKTKTKQMISLITLI